MNESWLEVKLKTTHEASDLVAEFLRVIGAVGVTIQDAVEIKAMLEDPASLTYADEAFLQNLDDRVHIKAYFAHEPSGIRFHPVPAWHEDIPPTQTDDLPRLERLIQEALTSFAENLDVGEGYLGASQVSDENWAENWKKHYRTLHLTPRLVINPSWLEYEPQEGQIVVAMDPGSAFGTGTHETTAMCARLLETCLKAEDSVLDLGTGSGILAILAARLGAGRVEAMDIDPRAIRVAESNVRQNEVEVACHVGELDAARQGAYDLIVANIIADVIADLMPGFRSRLHEHGQLIVSGIIEGREALVVQSAQKAGFALQTRLQDRDWVALVFKTS